MNAGLQKRWRARTPRERALVLGGAVVLAAALAVPSLVALQHDRDRLLARNAALKAEQRAVEAQAAEIGRLRSMRTGRAPDRPLKDALQSHVERGGYATAATRMEARSPDAVELTFGAVAFAPWLQWAIRLQSDNIRVSACRIEALDAPGMVTIVATFGRGRAAP